MIFELIVVVGLAGKPEAFGEYEDLTACRQEAHTRVRDPRPFDPEIHLFQSPHGEARAYCRPKA